MFDFNSCSRSCNKIEMFNFFSCIYSQTCIIINQHLDLSYLGFCFCCCNKENEHGEEKSATNLRKHDCRNIVNK